MPDDPRETRFTMDDLESSDWGRDPRFLPGWYILPGFILGVLFLVGLFMLF